MNHEIIFDDKELKKFFDIVLPDLRTTECYFVSLSARNKYLTEEERKTYLLGRSEMFERRIVTGKKNWDKFFSTIKKFEVTKGGYLTKSGLPMPNKAMVCYLNINPSHHLAAYKEFTDTMNNYYSEMASILEGGRDPENVLSRIGTMKTLMMNCYQRSRGVKHYLDIDFDIKDRGVLLSFTEKLKENKVEFFVVSTKSGYHVLLKKSTVKYNFHEDLENTRRYAFSSFGENPEIVLNKNEMIPLPGTYQGEYPVKILWEISNFKD